MQDLIQLGNWNYITDSELRQGGLLKQATLESTRTHTTTRTHVYTHTHVQFHCLHFNRISHYGIDGSFRIPLYVLCRLHEGIKCSLSEPKAYSLRQRTTQAVRRSHTKKIVSDSWKKTYTLNISIRLQCRCTWVRIGEKHCSSNRLRQL